MIDQNATRAVDLNWRKSSFSGPDGNCVECAELPGGGVAVRNSNHPDDGTLVFTRAELSAWILGCRAGEFDDLA
ncbi:DUF397 domain-containing protein [Nocardia sp. alder85J]|uniref:DUF397 domain-containing protein n=1 Tax=Nocardia sp. alder85J TaxID=2862949 RepID=UPI001CD53A1D|nr:DUF397 domain-containing protein [Nocardia sp. alder85J]MCX4095369.1 DUF397 domain-containing protein [Nocardia sp. alder85J]